MAVKSAKQKGYSAPIIFARKVQEKIHARQTQHPKKPRKEATRPQETP
jgi:hypothetical protein